MNRNSPFFKWFLLVLISLIWGSSFFLIKHGLKAFTPIQVGSLRIFIAFLAVLPFLFFIQLKKLTRANLFSILLVALFGSGFPPFLFAMAQTKIDSSVAGILNALTPLFTMVTGLLIFKTRIKTMQAVGVMIGLAGSACIILFQSGGGFQANIFYTSLVLLAGICYALGANILKYKLQEVSPIAITTMAFCFIGPFAGSMIFTSDFTERLATNPEAWRALGYLVILGFVGTAYALFLFNILIQSTSALFASTVTYLIPIVAIFWGVMDNEALVFMHFIGLGLILAGIYLSGK